MIAVEFGRLLGDRLDQRVNADFARIAGIESRTLADPWIAASGVHSSCDSVP